MILVGVQLSFLPGVILRESICALETLPFVTLMSATSPGLAKYLFDLALHCSLPFINLYVYATLLCLVQLEICILLAVVSGQSGVVRGAKKEQPVKLSAIRQGRIGFSFFSFFKFWFLILKFFRKNCKFCLFCHCELSQKAKKSTTLKIPYAKFAVIARKRSFRSNPGKFKFKIRPKFCIERTLKF